MQQWRGGTVLRGLAVGSRYWGVGSSTVMECRSRGLVGPPNTAPRLIGRLAAGWRAPRHSGSVPFCVLLGCTDTDMGKRIMCDSASEWENCPVADELWAVISWNDKDPDRDGDADLAVIEVALGRDAA